MPGIGIGLAPNEILQTIGGVGGLTYAEKVLAIQPGNLLAGWPLWEAVGPIADNIEGTAARDATYDGGVLGQPGIGDGRTSVLLDGLTNVVEIHTPNLAGVWNGQEFTISLWYRVSGPGVWTDGVLRRVISIRADANNWIYFTIPNAINQFNYEYNAGGVYRSRGVAPFNPVTWVNAVLTVSLAANELRGYINGVQQGVPVGGLGVWAGPLDANLTAAYAFDVGGFAGFDGYGQHVWLWNAALSPAQVAEIAIVP